MTPQYVYIKKGITLNICYCRER